MSDYISRQAVVDVICDMHIGGKDGVANALPNTYGADLREIIEQIDSLPSADAVEVVRCADCKHSYESVAGWVCSYGVCVDCLVSDDFYCSNGERNEAH